MFQNTNWAWQTGEQWAMLGPDGSGKSLLVEAILGRAVIVQGEVRGPFPRRWAENSLCSPTIGHVSPQAHRDLAVQESSFYQLRWHSGLEEGSRTVSEFLSHQSVEEVNPFEVASRLRNHRQFLGRRRQFVDWLGIKNLWRRRLVHLSNGEMRKTLLVHALLKSPHLLILEEPYLGLDGATRQKLARVILRLMSESENWPILITTQRVEEIPAATTHLLLIDNCQVIDQGPRREMLEIWRERFEEKVGSSGRTPQHGAGLLRRKKAATGQPLVELRSVTVTGERRRLLHRVSWTLRTDECWAMLGPNGAGKTTLLNLIQGDHPQAYSEDIRLFGHPTHSTQTVWQARQRIGWMSPELHQHYPPAWDAESVVCSGFFNSLGLHQSCSAHRRGIARRWLQDLGMTKFTRTAFGELSFGQQRLVLLARAAVKQPRLLILDEPCQGLDAARRQTMLCAIDRVVSQTSASLLFVTHHENEMPGCISHILRLSSGQIRELSTKAKAPAATPIKTLHRNSTR